MSSTTRVFLSVRSHMSKKDFRVLKYKAVWVARGTGGTEMYVSSVCDSSEKAVALARKWLARNPGYVDTTCEPERFGYSHV